MTEGVVLRSLGELAAFRERFTENEQQPVPEERALVPVIRRSVPRSLARWRPRQHGRWMSCSDSLRVTPSAARRRSRPWRAGVG